MPLSLIVFSGLLSPTVLREHKLVGAPTPHKLGVRAALGGERYALGEVNGRTVLALPDCSVHLDAFAHIIGELGEAVSAVMLYLSESEGAFALLRVAGGRVVRRHSYIGGVYVNSGTATGVEASLLHSFEAVDDDHLMFVGPGGDAFEPAQVGDALINAVLEETVGDLDELQDVALTLCDPPRLTLSMPPEFSGSGGIQLLRTLVAKEQVELGADVDLAALDRGMEPFLTGEGDSYKRANELIEWLIDQPGIEEVYIATEHLAKLLARW